MRAHKPILAVCAILMLGACGLSSNPARPTAAPPPPATTAAQSPTAANQFPAGPRADTQTILADLGATPCPDSDFTCVTLAVPRDHFDAANPATMDVVFGVLPATGERKGMFVTVVGGPGGAGLQSADNYTSAMDPSIPEHFDIVFFDQRGTGTSGGINCQQAAIDYALKDSRAETPDQEAALVEAARAFVPACVAEMGVAPADLAAYSTAQAVEDLEAFRAAMQDETFWLYGESYGTEFAQTYAAAHGDHLAGLLLDGTVDFTLSGPEFYTVQAQGFHDTLIATLNACNDDNACSAQTGGDAVAFYDDLYAELAAAPQTFNFPLSNGKSEPRQFTLRMLDLASTYSMYSEAGRMLFLRALAEAHQGSLVSLARVAYNYLGVDPDTLAPIPDPSWWDAMYYAVTCADDSYFTGTDDERAQAYLRAGDAGDSIPYTASIQYDNLACAFWPVHGPETRPAPLTLPGVPTLVLSSNIDPATPYSGAQAVYARLADGYLITEDGGPHVIYGWGVTCVDDLVTNFLVDGTVPAQKETTCDGVVTDAYVDIGPADAADFTNALQAMTYFDFDAYYTIDYYFWDLAEPLSVGCTYGGSFTVTPTDAGESWVITNCAYSQRWVLTGTATYDYNNSEFAIDVDVSGLQNGHLIYTLHSDGSGDVTGNLDNTLINLHRN